MAEQRVLQMPFDVDLEVSGKPRVNLIPGFSFSPIRACLHGMHGVFPCSLAGSGFYPRLRFWALPCVRVS